MALLFGLLCALLALSGASVPSWRTRQRQTLLDTFQGSPSSQLSHI